jgi:hypothetical protein
MHRANRVLSVSLLLIVLFSSTAGATKYAGEFLSTGVGGRALGMGGAFVAVAEGPTAGYWNPAGLLGSEGRQITLMHSERFGDLVNYDYGAYSQPVGEKSAMGASIVRLGVGDIPNTLDLEFEDYGIDGIPNTSDEGEGDDEWNHGEPVLWDESKIEWFSSSEWAFLVSYAREVAELLSLGGNAKFVRKSAGDRSAYGLGLDVGALLRVRDNAFLGLQVQDFTATALVWDTDRREFITPTIKIGGAYLVDIPKVSGKLTLAIDSDFMFENRGSAAEYSAGSMSLEMHYGIEYAYRDLVAVRAGLDRGEVTAGAGFRISRFGLDYAFGGHDDLGDTHRVSGSMAF